MAKISLHSQFERSCTASETSLPELLGAFSYALDLTEGQPVGHSVRAGWIAMQISKKLGLAAESRRDVYYATLLKDLGCSSNAARVAEIYLTDDRAFKHDFKLIGEGIGPALRFVLAKTGKGESIGRRSKAIAYILKNGPELVHSLIETRCTRGADIARLLRFPDAVAQGIYSLDEHWDGSGKPAALAGHAIPLASRIALLAQIADVFFTNTGPQSAQAEVARLAGKWLDPELCRVFAGIASSRWFWDQLTNNALCASVIADLPQEDEIQVDETYLDEIAAAFGQVIDAKSPYTFGHSERVSTYAADVGAGMGLGEPDLRALRRAALLHDVGKLGVSSGILEKPGKLDELEWEVMRGHAAQTAEILGRIAPLREMAMIAASHHERLDGKGYPLGLDEGLLALEARIITVCDFFDALTADRPYRSALSHQQAFDIMEREAGTAIDARCLALLQKSVSLD